MDSKRADDEASAVYAMRTRLGNDAGPLAGGFDARGQRGARVRAL
jgi:hypothetical protein